MSRIFFIALYLLLGLCLTSCKTEIDYIFAWPDYYTYISNSTGTNLKVKASYLTMVNDSNVLKDVALVVNSKETKCITALNNIHREAVKLVTIYTTNDVLLKELEQRELNWETKYDSIPDTKYPNEYGIVAFHYTFTITDEMIRQ